MHLLSSSTAGLDDLVEPVDPRQPRADVLLLSFSDSDLISFDRAMRRLVGGGDQHRRSHGVMSLRHLRHPMSVDLWLEQTARHARLIVLRLLGGRDAWRYGLDRLVRLARDTGVKLAILPGEDADDPSLLALSTVDEGQAAHLLGCLRHGGPDNLRAAAQMALRLAGQAVAEPPAPQPVPPVGFAALPSDLPTLSPQAPVVPIIFYRAAWLAGDDAPVTALCHALAARGMRPLPVYVASLKEPACAAFVRDLMARYVPAAIITATAFAAADGLFDSGDAPVFQLPFALTRREGWAESRRGLGAADLAMNVVLPELDGRIMAGVAAFKQVEQGDFGGQRHCPAPDRIAMAVDRIAAWVRLRQTAASERRIAMILPDYPGAPGRTGWAVGLDVPQSVLAALDDLGGAGYDTGTAPEDGRALLRALELPVAALPVALYREWLDRIPEAAQAQLAEAWGDPSDDPDVRDEHFHFRVLRVGKVTVALAPDRGSATDRRTDYHDPALPPRHALLAFGLWLRHAESIDALVHMGAHGTLEWLPGKAAGLSEACWPELVLGPLPAVYPFIVSNPGEAAQAKRRIAAVTLGHLPPAACEAGLEGPLGELERLIDEYAAADGFDPRRRERLAALILERAETAGVMATLSIPRAGDGGEALRRIDEWLCDVKDMAVRDGQHVFGRDDSGDPVRRASAEAERAGLLAALDGRRVAPGPSGAPQRGRRDVLPTGRNLFGVDPRQLPTQTAMDLGRLAAGEVIRHHLQTHGEMPRSVVLDLWGSATLRSGGEEIAHGLALMGCRPLWDHATGRVTGVEVQAPAVMGRPRVDVTWRISGLFRDMFAGQIALIDLAVRSVAARDSETDEDNPLAAAIRDGDDGLRIFGSAPGAYGSGVEALLGSDEERGALGAAYLSGASHAYGGAEAAGADAGGTFAVRVRNADALVHIADNPERDLLDGSADLAFAGGFAAARGGRAADVIVLDSTNPDRPRARSLEDTLARIVHGRALNPRFIAGQMRHGPRGAAELLEVADRLVGFAELTDAVPGHLIDLVHDAYVADPAVRAFLIEQNPAAARELARRLGQARAQGHWHPRRNDTHRLLAELERAV